VYVEIYGEYVRLRDLFVALIVCSVLAFIGYWITPYIIQNKHMVGALSITFGVLGALIGGVIVSFFIEPKRVVVEE